MNNGMSAGKDVLRKHLADVFAEVACYSTTEANRLLDKYECYRRAISDPSHVFWKADARLMLGEATQMEFDLRLAAQRHQHQDDAVDISYH